ncbi:MAG: enoyl-CoA hydratase/isomerase family protein [Candidatus Nanopelagicales bacterium]
MLTSLGYLLASRDWYPDISLDGRTTGAVRFIDLDAPVPDAMEPIQSRVALCIGVTSNPSDARVYDAAQQLDLSITSAPVTDHAFKQVPDVSAAIELIADRISMRPRSAMMLGTTLRQTTQLQVSEGIAAEAAAYSTLLAGPEFAAWLLERGARRPSPASEADRVGVSIDNSILEIRMTRRLRLNAIDGPMRAALVEAFDLAIADPSLDVRLTGEGPCFSNGGDLREFGTALEPATAWAVRMTQHPGARLAQIADRVHVIMHGPCVGAGVEMPAFAHHITADPATTFRLPELEMGLIPGAGGCVSIPRRIGRWRTLWLLLSGHAASASEALDMGLIDDISPVH